MVAQRDSLWECCSAPGAAVAIGQWLGSETRASCVIAAANGVGNAVVSEAGRDCAAALGKSSNCATAVLTSSGLLSVGPPPMAPHACA